MRDYTIPHCFQKRNRKKLLVHDRNEEMGFLEMIRCPMGYAIECTRYFLVVLKECVIAIKERNER